MTREEIAKAVIVTAEVMGHDLTPLAAREMARELASYPPAAVAGALRRCQRELSSRLTLAAVLQRIDDGHPGPEEAWALCPRDEGATVVWTDEIAEAFGVARPLLASGDDIAARMAFKESYGRLLQQARSERRAAKWLPSFGHSMAGRAEPIMLAVDKGRLSLDYARNVVHPGLPGFERYEARLLGDGGDANAEAVAALTADVGRSVPS